MAPSQTTCGAVGLGRRAVVDLGSRGGVSLDWNPRLPSPGVSPQASAPSLSSGARGKSEPPALS